MNLKIKQIPVIQQPAVVQLLDFLEEFLCLYPLGYFLCSYHQFSPSGFQFSPVIHPFFGSKFVTNYSLIFIAPNISTPSQSQKGKIEPWEIILHREKIIEDAEDERIYTKNPKTFNLKCFGEKISEMDKTRARRTLVTNWWLLHKESGLKIVTLF